MIISEKLYKLRNASGISQEELAEQMNVSRQSISKWESGSSIPGIDKILELSKFYGVTTDFLLQDSMEEMPGEVVVDAHTKREARMVSLEQVREYLALTRKAGSGISMGVVLCILSPMMFLILRGLQLGHRIALTADLSNGLGVAILLLMVATAVVLFILNGLQLKDYEFLDKEVFQLEYGAEGILEKEEKKYQPIFSKGVAVGVALCICSAIPFLFLGSFARSQEVSAYMAAVLLLMVAAGVYAMVRVGIQKEAYTKLLQKEDFEIQKKSTKKKLEVFTRVYWCVIVALYLGVSFVRGNWHISWVIWPVSGILYGAVSAILGAVVEKE